MVLEKNDPEAEVTDEEFNKIINNSHRLVVVDFWAEWCMPCLMLAPIIEDLAEQMKDIKFVKINVDDNEAISGKYKISSIPCLIIFKQGKEVDRIIGVHSSDVIENRIKKHFD